jgi:hypothetical protein
VAGAGLHLGFAFACVLVGHLMVGDSFRTDWTRVTEMSSTGAVARTYSSCSCKSLLFFFFVFLLFFVFFFVVFFFVFFFFFVVVFFFFLSVIRAFLSFRKTAGTTQILRAT